jgi:hypothetical protein
MTDIHCGNNGVVGFLESAIDKSIENWDDIQRYNACLDRLLARRVQCVKPEGVFARSKLAWKCALLQQSLLYRTTALASGCAASWNERNVLCSMLAARALIETIALTYEAGFDLQSVVAAQEPDAINRFLNEHLFATRNQDLIASGHAHSARYVLTLIDKFGKTIPGMREHYEFMSEWCHPNASGAFFTFGDLNKSTGEVKFAEMTDKVKGIQGHIVASFHLIQFMEPTLDRLDAAIKAIAEIDRDLQDWI